MKKASLLSAAMPVLQRLRWPLAALAVASGDWAINSARELVWVDGLTFFGATLALLGLYYAANQLIESHLKFQKMQNS